MPSGSPDERRREVTGVARRARAIVAVVLALAARPGAGLAEGVMLTRRIASSSAETELGGDWRPVVHTESRQGEELDASFGPVAVPAGAFVEVAVAVDLMARDAGATSASEPGAPTTRPPSSAARSAYRFELVAEPGGASLATLVLDPGARVPDRGWHELRADLGAGGESLTLHVRARPQCASRGGPEPAADAPPVSACTIDEASVASGIKLLVGTPRIVARDPRREPRRNLLLVSIDTLRADRLGCYGAERPTSPALDRLAASGVRFATAIAPATSTGPSHMTMLTGTLPCRHGVWGVDPRERLPDDIATLAERLAASGYATAAFTEDAYLGAPFGFARGFDTFRERKDPGGADTPVGLAPATFGDAIAWLRTHRDRRFFLFVHTYEVHAPRRPEGDYARLFGADAEPRDPRPGYDPAVDDPVRYDRMVRAADDQVGRLLAVLDEIGSTSDTLVVVTADHGEEFFEHGNAGHGFTAYEEVARVPLIFWAPGLTAPGIVKMPIGLVDLLPTTLDLLDLPVPPGLDGRSVAGLVRSASGRDASSSEALYIETGPGTVRALRTAHLKLMRFEEPRRYLGFDLTADPREWQPIALPEASTPNAAAAPDVRELGRLRVKLDAAAERCIAGRREAVARLGGRDATSDVARRAKLRALGYVQ